MSSSNTNKKGKGKAPAPGDILRIGPASTVLPGELNEQGKFVCGMFKPGSDTELCGEVIANKKGSISSHKHKIHHAQYLQSNHPSDIQTVKTTQYEKLNAPDTSSHYRQYKETHCNYGTHAQIFGEYDELADLMPNAKDKVESGEEEGY
ncbi:uncharacterized protein PG986_000084 [Apiospora aurea]|uniref:Uncharacterized protein n=1 Tax=Apiospora aurea TaxID=335848 RepID=A0ABR1QTF0_9PEZI